MKIVLGVHARACNLGVRSQLGKLPLHIKTFSSVLKYWARLDELNDNWVTRGLHGHNDSCVGKRLWSLVYNGMAESCFTVGSHDPFYDPLILLALFQLIKMLIRIINFFQFENKWLQKLDHMNWPLGSFIYLCTAQCSRDTLNWLCKIQV